MDRRLELFKRKNPERDRSIFEQVRLRGQGIVLKELSKKWKISVARVRMIYHRERRLVAGDVEADNR